MLSKEFSMLFVIVELLRGQYCRNDRHLYLELNLHQCRNDRLRDELMTIDAAVDYKSGGDHGLVTSGAGQEFRLQGDLERTRNLEHVDPWFRIALGHFI